MFLVPHKEVDLFRFISDEFENGTREFLFLNGGHFFVSVFAVENNGSIVSQLILVAQLEIYVRIFECKSYKISFALVQF